MVLAAVAAVPTRPPQLFRHLPALRQRRSHLHHL